MGQTEKTVSTKEEDLIEEQVRLFREVDLGSKPEGEGWMTVAEWRESLTEDGKTPGRATIQERFSKYIEAGIAEKFVGSIKGRSRTWYRMKPQ